ANGEEPSALELVVSQEETSYLFVLGTAGLEVGQALKISMAPGTDQLTLNGQGLAAETVSLVAVRLDTAGEAIFATSDLPLTIGDVLALDLATWDGEGAMDLLVDEEGDGAFDSPIPLENEPLGALIEGAETAAPIIALLDNVAPYLSEPQIGALLHSLSASDLSGDDVGELLFALAELELTDRELVTLLTNLDLPLEELAEFLVALRLDTDHLGDLIAPLGLSPQTEEELRVRLAELAEVKAALAEWEFLNVDDLETLIGFLEQKGLSRYQLEYLMKKLNLPDSLREMILAALGFLVEQPAPVPTPTPTPTPAPTLTPTVLATGTSPPAPSSTPTQIPSQVSTLPETGGPTPNRLSGLLILGGAALLALGCTGIWKSRRNH
ncbi:MAG: hypothetical protein PVF47_04490, partial [Anaerolineae bacterium]